MKLFDTSQQQKITFATDKTIGIYVCGITPYDSAHLGHVFTFMTYDIMQRWLQHQGHVVKLVRNITDVDEPIYKKADELGMYYMDLANQEIKGFRKTMAQLNFLEPHAEPRASEYIDEMANAVKQLMDSGYAYRVDQDVYFDVSTINAFGSHFQLPQTLLVNLMKKRGGDPGRAGKRNPLDFLLWKHVNDSNDPARWESPVGIGRPGWHIECSVMSSHILGVPFTLHGGGNDLIFPHHECEVAQTTALQSSDLAKAWMHVAPLLYAGEKMSKSLGNLVFAKDLLTDYKPQAIRLALMQYHYRVGGEWLSEYITHAQQLWNRIIDMRQKCKLDTVKKLRERVFAALDDDLNTVEVFGALQWFVDQPPKNTDGESNAACQVFDEIAGVLGLSPTDLIQG